MLCLPNGSGGLARSPFVWGVCTVCVGTWPRLGNACEYARDTNNKNSHKRKEEELG